MNKSKNYSRTFIRAFTLVELLVVIAIIALLTGIITVNFAKSRSRARDSQRVSDLAQIQLAMGLYFDRCGQYPKTPLLVANYDGCPPTTPQVTLGSYIGTIPKDPTTSNSYDYYVNDPVNTRPTNYILHVTLENPSASVQKNSLQDTTGSWYSALGVTASPTCYDNNTANVQYCLGPK